MNSLLSYVLCPACGGKLSRTRTVRCARCHKNYPMKYGILNLLEASSLEDAHNLQQKQYYDKEYSDDYANTQFEWRDRYINRILPYLPVRKPAVILDAACGQGYVAIDLAKRGYSVIASDISLGGLLRASEIAKKLKLENRVLFVAADINSFKLKPQSISGAILLHVIEHLKQDKSVVTSLHKFLKKGATVIVGVPLAFRYVFPPFIPVYMYSDRKVGHFRHYSIEDIRALFTSGYRVLRVYYTGHLIKLVGAVLSALRVRQFERVIEDMDERQLDSKFWASNIMAVLRKQ